MIALKYSSTEAEVSLILDVSNEWLQNTKSRGIVLYVSADM